MSTYEGEHTIFGLLGQANLTQNDVLQFHPYISGFKNQIRRNITMRFYLIKIKLVLGGRGTCPEIQLDSLCTDRINSIIQMLSNVTFQL
jgi:hypothetical protein